MDAKWLSPSHRSDNVKHNPSKAVSLSKCHFHFRMCSAISAAATHSVQRAGLAPGHPVGAEVQGCTRALPAHRLRVPRAPSSIPVSSCAMKSQHSSAGCLQWPRPQAATVVCYYPQWEPCKILTSNSSCSWTLSLLPPPSKPLPSIEVSP